MDLDVEGENRKLKYSQIRGGYERKKKSLRGSQGLKFLFGGIFSKNKITNIDSRQN